MARESDRKQDEGTGGASRDQEHSRRGSEHDTYKSRDAYGRLTESEPRGPRRGSNQRGGAGSKSADSRTRHRQH
jgi:hypothetical protein